MLTLLVHLIIGLIVIGLLYWVVMQIPLPQPIKQIANVVIVVLAALWLIYVLMNLANTGLQPLG